MEATVEINLDMKIEVTGRNNRKESKLTDKSNFNVDNKTKTLTATSIKDNTTSLPSTDKSISDFACCTVQDLDSIISLIQKYCEGNGIKIAEVFS